MPRVLAALLALSLAATLSSLACSDTPQTTADASTEPEEEGPAEVAVSGKVDVHPSAKAWYAAQSRTDAPTVEGLKFAVDEPLLALKHDPGARLAIIEKLPASGEFRFDKVPTEPIKIGLVTALIDERGGGAPPGPDGGTDAGLDAGAADAATAGPDAGPDAGADAGADAGGDAGGTGGGNGGTGGAGAYREFITSASPAFDGKPFADITGVKSYAVPLDFATALNKAAGAPANNTIEMQGFILGLVLDAAEKPVSGVTVVGTESNLTPDRILYLSDDWSTATPGDASGTVKTGVNGAFLVVGAVTPQLFKVSGHPEYAAVNSGTSTGSVFQLVFRPKP